MRGHRTSILGVPAFVTTESRSILPPRHSDVGSRNWTSVRDPRPRPEHYQSPPEWRDGPGDPNIKRKWLMHIEDERAGEWKL